MNEYKNIIKKQQEQILYLQKQMEEKQIKSSKKKINPYKILEIPKNYDKKMLKEVYMKKALILHPDRGGNHEDFKLLNLCYKILLKKLEEKDINDYIDLKNNHNKHISENNENLVSNKKINKDNFDVNVFNEVYKENKLKDNFNDTGYGDWLKKDNIKNNNVNLKGKFTNKKFNNVFEKYKEDISNNKSTKIIENPEELMSITNKDSLQVLGIGKIKNYSGNANGLGYRDLKDAYENPTLININKIDISNRKDIIYYEKDRENISYEMNKSELMKYNMNLENNKKKENRRLKRLKQNDNLISKNYELIHQRLIN